MPLDSLPWPEGTERVHLENLEGIPLVRASVRAAEMETTGVFVFDTGAGYLGLDLDLARRMKLTRGPSPAVGITREPLQRFQIGSLQIDQVYPVLTLDAGIIRRATDRPVIGLLGYAPLMHRSVWLDYRNERMAIAHVPRAPRPERAARRAAERRRAQAGQAGTPMPDSIRTRLEASLAAHAGIVSERARAIPFDLAGDGKMLVQGRVADPDTGSLSGPLTLVVDTGASRTVLFEETAGTRVAHMRAWKRAAGLRAPTLYGDSRASLANVPRIVLTSARGDIALDDVPVALIDGPLGGILSDAIDQPVHGLIGYSVLRSFRVGIDYVHRILWLEPLPAGWDERPHEDVHVGIQVERVSGRLEVTAVIEGSPAARAGIRVGDVLVRIGQREASHYDVSRLARVLEGPAGSQLRLTLRRGTLERTYRLTREPVF